MIRWIVRARIHAHDWLVRRQGIVTWIIRAAYGLTRILPSSRLRLSLAIAYQQYCHKSPGIDAAFTESIRILRDFPTLYTPKTATTLPYTCILKAPLPVSEKGLLLVGFEYELEAIACHPKIRDITSQYHVILIPSWQPYYSRAISLYLARCDSPLHVFPSSTADYYHGVQRHPRVALLPFHASSWSRHPRRPTPTKRDIDILVLANFGRYKRHWKLFEALGQMKANPRVVLIGLPWGGRTKHSLEYEARAFGADGRYTILDNVQDDETVIKYLERARWVMGLSHREGSFVALAEAMHAGAAVMVLADAVVGMKDYVNCWTGYQLDPSERLSIQLDRLLGTADRFAPAEWAEANISASANVERLNAHLRRLAETRNEAWSLDIAPFNIRRFQVRFDEGPSADIVTSTTRFAESFGIKLSINGTVTA